MDTLRIMIVGAAGRMGREVVRAVSAQPDLSLVAAVDQVHKGEDAVALVGATGAPVPITASLQEAIAQTRPEAAVDFTLPGVVKENARTAITAGLPYVIGASGLKEADLQELAALCAQHSTPA